MAEAKTWADVTDVDYLTYLVQPICDHPVVVVRQVDELGVLLTLNCDLRDMGRIVGKKGATAKSIRLMLRIFGVIHSERINLKINEPEGSTHVRKDQSDGE